MLILTWGKNATFANANAGPFVRYLYNLYDAAIQKVVAVWDMHRIVLRRSPSSFPGINMNEPPNNKHRDLAGGGDIWAGSFFINRAIAHLKGK